MLGREKGEGHGVLGGENHTVCWVERITRSDE